MSNLVRGLLAAAVQIPLLTMTGPVLAADDEVARLREEMRALRADYERRLEALERRLDRAQGQAVPATGSATAAGAAPAAPAATPVAVAPAPVPVAVGAPRGNAFNPDLSLILQGQYRRLKDVPERGIGGFWPSDAHAHAAPRRGFSIDHSELVLEANADPTVKGRANFAVTDGGVEVEEAWLQTLALGGGLVLKGGRLRSAMGYLNEQHPHQWDFADAPLINQAMFGPEGYKQDGVQLKWVAPTPFLLELGAEAGRGAAFPGTDRNRNGAGAASLFARVGGDVGDSHSWRVGVSALRTRAEGREAHFEEIALKNDEVLGAFSGRSRVTGLDFLWKWAPDGNPRDTNFKLQGEIFQRRESGSLGCAAGETDCGALGTADYASRQRGAYLQGVWQFMPRWRVGLRADRLDSGRVDAGSNAGAVDLAAYKPRRDTAMVDFSPSEYSRFRLQLAKDRSMPGVTDRQLWLQYIISLGAHGAHKF